MNRAYYSDSIRAFVATDNDTLLGRLAAGSDDSTIRRTQKDAWTEQIDCLKPVLADFEGAIFFEYSIPRMGQRIDVVLLIDSVIFVLEFKVGARGYFSADMDQVVDYALDLKNFHETERTMSALPIILRMW